MIEVTEHLGRLVRVEVGDDDGLDLRVLVANHIGNGARLHPLQAVQTTGAAAKENAVDEVARLVLAQRRSEHLADIAVGADTQAGLVADDLDELTHDLLDLLAVDIAHAGHGDADALYFLRPEVAQHLRGIGLTQREQENGGLVDLAKLGSGTIVTHRR